ncbi:hypothetical protein CFBP4996_25450 [Agrobacterium leguminum]|uniref:Uncharacterized protein n=1 Tax=Agrobacterium deltaense NCPPB 1641 TaxID=1183425 RepID=A0A1S7TRT7_9HYPH|nr:MULTISPECIES: hypothetical protein [Agrobacterium]WFS69324.1 hypothetical protein CFBP4996_25450 [Agrobacterium leguminum]CVI57325.1 hypothetical protein AGR7A_Lc10020 [Agrobacterium deltaense NCPPB 1641]
METNSSDLPFTGADATRPTDDELVALSDETKTNEALLAIVEKIISRQQK